MAGREHRISSYIIGFSHYLVKGLDRNITLFKHGGSQLRSNEHRVIGNDVRRPRGEQKKPDSQIFPALKHQIYYSFYDVLGNINGKLTLKVYLEQILKPIVKP